MRVRADELHLMQFNYYASSQRIVALLNRLNLEQDIDYSQGNFKHRGRLLSLYS